MHSYRERLRAPVSWWVNGMLIMFTFGSIVWFGFPAWVAVVTYAALFAVTAAFLINWGRATIEIDGSQLRALDAVLPLAATGEVRPLDERAANVLRGPRADPRAYLLIRPYLRMAVYIEVTSADVAAPYWLLFTRHPAELAAAIESARAAGRADSAVG